MYCRSNDKYRQIIFLTEDSVLYFPCAYFSAINLSQTLSSFSLPEIILSLFYKELTKKLQVLCCSLLRSASPLATPLMLYIPAGSTIDIWQVLQNDRGCSSTLKMLLGIMCSTWQVIPAEWSLKEIMSAHALCLC